MSDFFLDLMGIPRKREKKHDCRGRTATTICKHPSHDKEEMQAVTPVKVAADKRISQSVGYEPPAPQTKCRNCEESNPDCPDCNAMTNRAKRLYGNQKPPSYELEANRANSSIYSTRQVLLASEVANQMKAERAKYEARVRELEKKLAELRDRHNEIIERWEKPITMRKRHNRND